MTKTTIKEFVMTPAIEWLESSSNLLKNYSTSAHREMFELVNDHDCENSCNCGCGDDGTGRCYWADRDESNMVWATRRTEEEALHYFLDPEDLKYDNEYYQAFVDEVSDHSVLWQSIGK